MKAGKKLLEKLTSGSISRKYTMGYLIMLFIVILIFGVSFFTSELLSAQYRGAIGELLDLNGLFIDVENTNRNVYDYYLYLRPASNERYLAQSAVTRGAVEEMKNRLDEEYSREVMDLCCMIDTYLTQSDALIKDLTAFRNEVSAGADNAALAESYHKTQNTISYINQSFQEVYTAKLVTTQQLQTGMQRVQQILTAFQLAMLALALLVCLSFYRKVVRGMTDSVNQLTEFADRLTRTPTLQQHVQIDTGDELSVFADAFNEMIDTIHTQMEQIEQDSRVREQLTQVEVENLRISAALQSSQLRLLQSRINPHFLFNTLNMILQTAQMENATETAQLMEATSEFLRYNLRKVTGTVTLGDEIENTRNYVYIQRQRFGSRIDFVFEVDEQCAGQQVPCMILQPLVENSVSYGVGPQITGGRVTVRLYGQCGRCCLEVEDNGKGFEEETLAALRTALDKRTEDDSHMGLCNVYLRLQLFFGGGVEFTIDSKPGRTLIHIGLPRQTPTQGK